MFTNNKANFPSFGNNTQKDAINNTKKVNTKSMRSLENIQTSKQFFSNNNKTKMPDIEEKLTEANQHDISIAQDSDMSETPTSNHRVLTEDSGIDHHRIGNFVNLANVSSNALMTPGSVVNAIGSKEKKEAATPKDSIRGDYVYAANNTSVISNHTNPSVSPNLTKRKLPSGGSKPNTGSIKLDDDALFADLKPLKFDGLFKREFTKDELEEELKKIEAFNQERESIANKKTVGSSRTLKAGFANDNLMTDNAYPFRQESFKLSCTIL